MIDLQETTDFRGIPLQKVGIRGFRHAVTVPGCRIPVLAETQFTVSLAEDSRAIHMSRLVELLQQPVSLYTSSLKTLLEETMNRLGSCRARLEICFPLLMKKSAPVTKLAGELVYECSIELEMQEGSAIIQKASVVVPVTSVCPCSKAISKHGAHNQRGMVAITAHGVGAEHLPILIGYAEDGASCAVFPILKRQDEKHVTEAAYENAKFVEDIARDIVIALKKDKSITRFSVSVDNMESIHSHNAYACFCSDS